MIFKPKFFTLLQAGIEPAQLRQDVMAGIVVGVVALPLAIAFAVAAGLSPERGLVTAVVAGGLISLFGGSRVQIGGPTGAFVVIVYSVVQNYGIDGLILSTMLAGIFLILFGVLRLGSLLKYFPQPLIVGFTTGIAVVIFSTQVNDALGLGLTSLPGAFHEKWLVYFNSFGTINIYACVLAGLTVFVTCLAPLVIKKIPGSFLALILVSLVAAMFDFPVETIGSRFGDLPVSFVPLIPDCNLKLLPKLIAPALTIALLGSIESLLSAVVADGMISGNHRSNTELIAQGIANIVAPLFGGIPATGAIARTAANVKNGGRTPVAGIVHSLTLLIIMIFCAPLAMKIPMPALAGILVVVAYKMSEWRVFVDILGGASFDRIILLSTFFLTVFADLTVAIQVGVVLSALLFMKRMSDIAEEKFEEGVDSDIIDDYSKIPEGISIYEISGPLFFASARHYAQIIQEIGNKGRVLVLRLRHVAFADQTGVHNLKNAIQALQSNGVHVVLSGVHEKLYESLHKGGVVELVTDDCIFDSFENALSFSMKILA